jgi:hypothetical protein
MTVTAAPRLRAVTLAALAALTAAVARSAEPAATAGASAPVPRVMADAPPDRGRWRIELLSRDGRPLEPGAVGREVQVCMTAAEAVARRAPDPAGGRCTAALPVDLPAQAVIEVTCPGPESSRTRSTITRAGERTWRVATDADHGGRASRVEVQLAYLGACASDDRTVTLGRDSAVCRDARQKLDSGESARQCQSSGADRAQCEATLARTRARIEALCR